MENKTEITVGYFKVRIYVEHVKLVLECKQIPYTFEGYIKEQLPDGRWLGGEWYLNKKNSMGLDFPNMPYYIEKRPDGSEFKMTESMAIFRHLGRKFSLYGDGSLEHAAVVDMLMDVALELRFMFVDLTYPPGFEQRKAEYLIRAQGKLDNFEEFLNKNGTKWLAGNEITLADFMLWPVLDFYQLIYPDFLTGYPKLKEFKEQFSAIPQIAAYLSSDKFSPLPINSPYADWGGQKM